MKLSSTRLIEHLQQHIEDLKEQMREDIVRLQGMHVGEMTRLLEENKRLQQQVERLTLRVGLPSTLAEQPEEPRAPVDPDAPPMFTGSTWERVKAREIWMRSPAGKRWMEKESCVGSVKVLSGETVEAKGN